MMQLSDAVNRAETFLRELRKSTTPNELSLVRAELRDKGWVFEYTSTAFLASRSFVDALGGNVPLLVHHDGSVELLPLGVEAAGDAYHG